ncbi:unnamed protein product, partial [Rotaria sp. Silwood1]
IFTLSVRCFLAAKSTSGKRSSRRRSRWQALADDDKGKEHAVSSHPPPPPPVSWQPSTRPSPPKQFMQQQAVARSRDGMPGLFSDLTLTGNTSTVFSEMQSPCASPQSQSQSAFKTPQPFPGFQFARVPPPPPPLPTTTSSSSISYLNRVPTTSDTLGG